MWPKVTSTNLVVIPNIAVIHIQKIAAGPPVHIAKATPPILPVPTAPDIAVVNASKPVVSPPELDLVPFPETSPQAFPKNLNCGKPRYIVKKIPVPTSKIGNHQDPLKLLSSNIKNSLN